MQEDLVKMRRASSEVLATQRMLEIRVANAKRDGVSSYGCPTLKVGAWSVEDSQAGPAVSANL